MMPSKAFFRWLGQKLAGCRREISQSSSARDAPVLIIGASVVEENAVCSRSDPVLDTMKAMPRILQAIDWIIRISAVIVILTFGLAMLLLVSVMATDSGTTQAMAAGLAIFVSGAAIFALIVFAALFPGWFAKRLPGPENVGKVLVRVPVYVVGTVGMGLLIRQAWQLS